MKTNDYSLLNSKKISEFKRRDTLSYHPENSWIVIAQYNSLFDSYHNLALNLKTLTDYSINASKEDTSYVINTNNNHLINLYNLEELKQFSYIGNSYDYNTTYSYISYSEIASNFSSYIYSYVMNSMMWEYFPDKSYTFNEAIYLYTEDGTTLLTDRGKKIMIN